MKKSLLLIAALAFSFGSAIAQEPGVDKTITSNSSLEIKTPSTVACGDNTTGITSNNAYYKLFNLPSLGVEDEFHIQEFQFAIQSLDYMPGTEEEIYIQIELYKTSKTDFPATWGGPDYEIVSTTYQLVTEEDSGKLVTHTLDEVVTIEEGASLIAKISHERLESSQLYLGSNDAPDTVPSYLSSEACNINGPTLFTAVGDFPNVHMIMVLKGVEGFLGVKDFVDANLSLYPNPASDQFEITSGNETIQSVTLRDILGRSIQTINVNGLNQTVNISNLPKGLYLVEVEIESGIAVKKLIKK